MPIYLRLYYLKRLEQQYKEEKSVHDKQNKKIQRPKIKKPPKIRR
jgi:hypothetical protein